MNTVAHPALSYLCVWLQRRDAEAARRIRDTAVDGLQLDALCEIATGLKPLWESERWTRSHRRTLVLFLRYQAWSPAVKTVGFGRVQNFSLAENFFERVVRLALSEPVVPFSGSDFDDRGRFSSRKELSSCIRLADQKWGAIIDLYGGTRHASTWKQFEKDLLLRLQCDRLDGCTASFNHKVCLSLYQLTMKEDVLEPWTGNRLRAWWRGREWDRFVLERTADRLFLNTLGLSTDRLSLILRWSGI